MHMTLEADYAVRIVEFLAAANQKVDARTISEETHVPLRFALKILRKLVADDIMISYKGAHGGYMLAHPAGEITLRRVIESVETSSGFIERDPVTVKLFVFSPSSPPSSCT